MLTCLFFKPTFLQLYGKLFFLWAKPLRTHNKPLKSNILGWGKGVLPLMKLLWLRWELQLNLAQQQVTRSKFEIILDSFYYLGARGKVEELIVLGTQQIRVEM